MPLRRKLSKQSSFCWRVEVLCFFLVLRWSELQGGGEQPLPYPQNKLGKAQISEVVAALGRCGGEKRSGTARSADSGVSVEASTGEVLQRRRRCAAATLGQWGHFAPRRSVLRGLLFLQRINLLKGKPTATLVTYNTIIKGYCDSGKTNAALKILELMEANGCEPDEWSYNELISGFCKISEMESASRLFNEMVGHGRRPDEVTYTTLISGCCKDEKLDRAAEMLEQMKGSGCRPTVRTYNVLIHALTKQNESSAAEKLCEVMLEEKISPNVVTYSTMIDGLCRNGATSLALEMLNRMAENSCLPSLHTYSSLIQALGQEGKVEEAEELFSDLLRQGHTLDEDAYIKMIEVYVISGKVDRAFDLLGKMINAGCQPTLWTYAVLIKGLQNEYLMGDRNLCPCLMQAIKNMPLQFSLLS